ncbi:MAG: AAA family ATPase [Verrucomicrobiia bacterium]
MTRISQGWVGSDVESRIAAHVHAWEKIKPLGDKRRLETYPFVAISREFGCEALPLAQQLVQTLNERCHPSIPWVSYDRELLDKVAEELHMQRDILDMLDGERRDEMSELFDNIINRKVADAVVVRKLAELIRTLAIHGHAVLVGRGSWFVTQDLRNGLHIRLVAPRAWRIHTIAASRNLSIPEARKVVAEGERQRNHYLNTFFVLDPEFPFHHDLVIDNSRFNLVQIVEIVFAALSARFGQTLVSA